MKRITEAYINGELTSIEGTEIFDLINPTNHEKIGEVGLKLLSIPKKLCQKR